MKSTAGFDGSMVTFDSAAVTFLTIRANIKTPSGSSHKPDGHFTTLILSQFESRAINPLIHLLIEWLFETPSIMLCAVVLLLLLVTRLRVIAPPEPWLLLVTSCKSSDHCCSSVSGHWTHWPGSSLPPCSHYTCEDHTSVRWTIPINQPIHIFNKICTCRI